MYIEAYGFTWFAIPILVLLISSLRIINEYERGVVFRLGKVISKPIGPGLVIVIPLIDRMVKVGLRTITLDIPAQDVITRDNVTLKVNAVVYFQVIDPIRSMVAIENYMYATSQLAQTTLRSVMGEVDLDQLLSERNTINLKLQEILHTHTEMWGIKVSQVETKQIDLPIEMQRAMAKQAEAERERRAKVIAADGEYQAAKQLAAAAETMGKQELTLQLRYLQTLKDVSSSQNNSTIVFPFPTEFLDFFKKK